ncbi:MAG TPA: hypothetical protein VIH03_05070, partial [Nitrososphaerales archaeon]
LIATFFILIAVGTSVEFPWNVVVVILSSIIVSVLLIQNIPKFFKYMWAPCLDVFLYTYKKGGAEQKGMFQKDVGVPYNKEIRALVNSEIQITIAVKPKWSYHINTIEIHGASNSQIDRADIFASDRYWQAKGYTDMDGAYKFSPDLSIRKGDITDPLMIDANIKPQLKLDERRTITIRISTKESRKLFKKDFELIGSVGPS